MTMMMTITWVALVAAVAQLAVKLVRGPPVDRGKS